MKETALTQSDFPSPKFAAVFNLIRNLPNFLTLTNLWLGLWAVWLATQGDYYLMWWVMLGAGLCDLLDGWTARLLKVASPLGKDLDSLADVVTFGVAPAMALFQRTLENEFAEAGTACSPEGCPLALYMPYVRAAFTFLIALGAAWRLARFNNDPEQSVWFKGLPTPAAGLFVVALLNSSILQDLSQELLRIVLLGLAWLMPVLMLSTLPVFSLKTPLPPRRRRLLWGSVALAAGALTLLLKFDAAVPILAGFFLLSYWIKRTQHAIHS